MTPSTAQRLFDALTHAGIAAANGTPIRTYLRQQANLHHGETRRMLKTISELPDIETFMSTFLREMSNDSESCKL